MAAGPLFPGSASQRSLRNGNGKRVAGGANWQKTGYRMDSHPLTDMNHLSWDNSRRKVLRNYIIIFIAAQPTSHKRRLVFGTDYHSTFILLRRVRCLHHVQLLVLSSLELPTMLII